MVLHIRRSQNKVQILVLYHNLHKACTYSTNESGVVWEGQLTCSRPCYQLVKVPNQNPAVLAPRSLSLLQNLPLALKY